MCIGQEGIISDSCKLVPEVNVGEVHDAVGRMKGSKATGTDEMLNAGLEIILE